MSGDELICFICNDGFVEEIDNNIVVGGDFNLFGVYDGFGFGGGDMDGGDGMRGLVDL